MNLLAILLVLVWVLVAEDPPKQKKGKKGNKGKGEKRKQGGKGQGKKPDAPKPEGPKPEAPKVSAPKPPVVPAPAPPKVEAPKPQHPIPVLPNPIKTPVPVPPTNSKTKFNYTYQRFVVIWPGTMCSKAPCRFGFNKWDRKSFVVNGLWPNSNDPGYLQEMKKPAGDVTCRISRGFQLRKIAPLVPRLKKIMPGLRTAPQAFWKYQYDRHGSCKIFLEKLRGNKASDGTLMKMYFEEIIRLHQITVGRFRPRTSQFKGTVGLALALGVNPAYISVTEKNGDILQIQFCMTPTSLSVGRPPNYIPCPNAKAPTGILKLPGYRMPKHSHLSWKEFGESLHHCGTEGLWEEA